MTTATENLPVDRVPRDQRRQELAAVTFQPHGQMFQPKDGRELMDMANLMSTAGLMVKDIYRNNPGACMGLIAVCAPYGLNPLQVSWKTYQIKQDAPIAYEAQVIVAMLNASGAIKGSLRYRFEGEGASRVCIASGLRRGDEEPVEVWSPPLGQITVKNSPLWKTDPDQQLAYYTGRSWARRYAPEMLLGIYDVDELEGVAIGPTRARDVTPGAETPLARKAREARERKQAEASAQVSDAEVVHWTEDAPLDAAFPGSEHWAEGELAFAKGVLARDCPYDEGDERAIDWLAGHKAASEKEAAE